MAANCKSNLQLDFFHSNEQDKSKSKCEIKMQVLYK